MLEGNLIRRVAPAYPPLARSARIQGSVVLSALISKAGTIENLRVLSGHPMLVAAAIEAVSQWRYRPYILNGEPIEVETQITVNFLIGWKLTRGCVVSGGIVVARRNLGARAAPAIIAKVASTAEILSRVATRPTWAEVSLTTLRQNFRTVQKHVGANVTVCAVVKADAYGHGAVECSRALEAEGAKWLGVTSLDEAIPLREAGVRANILLMTGFWRGEESEIVRLHLTPTVWEPWHIESLDRAAAALGRGAASGALESRHRHGPPRASASINFPACSPD